MIAQLSDRAMVLLRHGDTEGRFEGDGSKIIGSLVLDAVNHGLDRTYLRKLLENPQHKGGFACLRRRRANLSRWFDSEWDRALAKATRSPMIGDKNEATLRAVELAEHAECLTWKGTGGATDRAVWLYVLSVAAKAGRLGPLGLAVRTVGEGAAVERRTAGRSLARLTDRGLLRRITVGRGRHASLFQVQAMVHNCPTVSARRVHNCPTPSHTGGEVGPEWGSYAPDCWRWSGLGLAKARVWSLLSDEVTTTSEMAEILGVSRWTARRHLITLAEHGLAEHDDDGWIRGPASLDSVAEQIRTDGMGERQRERHITERARHDNALCAHAAAVDEPPFYVDPETGEVIHTDDLLPAPPNAAPRLVLVPSSSASLQPSKRAS